MPASSRVLLPLKKGDVRVEGRGFRATDFVPGLPRRGALTIEPRGGFGKELETGTGWASERRVWPGCG